ncbi:hypothetical protein [Curtobacterium sp. Leaf261]|uniref:hypothetical protein n=1 Tax=Curtobacterium sp. Leaf261 TaxID=1736311 RepID=UPI0006F8AE70|nr:hypothetical protein [Curtobacterium sp. Leaf261]KQO62389.1 hypothetical protein ASF23_11475 [Curtobacterium sp. Leaf261]
MTNATTTSPAGDAARTTPFRAIQLLPAPVTVVALGIAAGHDLGATHLAVIAVVGTLATIGSALLPTLRPRHAEVG